MNARRSNIVEDLFGARAVQLALALGVSAAAGWLIATGNSKTVESAAIGLLAFGALMRWPALSLVSLLIICQELDPAQGFGGPSGSGLLFLGHQVYFKTEGRISLLTFAAVLTALRVLATSPPRRPHKSTVALMVALGAYYTGLLWIDGTSLTSAINQDSRFALLFAACFVVGASVPRDRDWAAQGIPVLTWVLTGMALIGLYLTATGQGESQGGTSLIFYDSAMGAIAGAFVLAALTVPTSQRTRRMLWLGGVALVVVILSSRRNVWAAMVVAFVLSLLSASGRARMVVRALYGIAGVLILLAIFKPSVLTQLGHQFSAIWGATQGTAQDASVAGHLSDVSAGWRAVKHSPLSGVGPNGQVPGLVVESTGPLYIHNQVLESWLRFGLIGAVLVIGAQVAFVFEGLRVIKRPNVDFLGRWGAMLLLMAPIAMLTAPFLTNTQRWPAVLGFAAGVVGSVGRR